MGNGSFQAVELPYISGELSLVALLPRNIQGCAQLEAQLSPAFLARCLGEMKSLRVELFLPRFKVESGFKLKDRLGKMGMPDAFTPQADFSGMDGARDLFIAEVFHKAWVDVNEEGTEAAAATVVTAALRGVPSRPPAHPFIFCIRDTRSGSLLFLGRLADPTR